MVFKSLGYTKLHSDTLAEIYLNQGKEKFGKRDFSLGKKDRYGQRIAIEIVLPGIGESEGKTAYKAYA